MHETSSKKRIHIRGLIYVLAFLALITAGLRFLDRLTMRPDSEFKYQPFFDDDTDYDVFFFGTSHVTNGIYCMQLWKDYGITSYNFANHTNSLAASYWVMRQAVRMHKPRIAILDVSTAEAETGAMASMSFAHETFDAWPMTPDKLRAIKTVAPSTDDQLQLIFPLLLYHDRWSELTKADVSRALSGLQDPTPGKGSEVLAKVEKHPNSYPILPAEDMAEQDTVGMAYIRKFITYCRDHDIQPALMLVPFAAPPDRQRAMNRAALIAEEMDVPFIDMFHADLIDPDIDWFDKDTHLNVSGARKVTAYMGDYLTSKMGLTSHSSDPAYSAAWTAAYDHYRSTLRDKMLEKRRLTAILALLYDENFRAEMTVSPEYQPDRVEQKLIDELTADGSLEYDKNSLQPAADNIRDRELKARKDAENPLVTLKIYDTVTGEEICEKKFIEN